MSLINIRSFWEQRIKRFICIRAAILAIFLSCLVLVFIGTDTVLPKTKIYEGAVVAAGAVVTKNCEAYTIYGGIPAKKIGERSKKLFYEFTGRHEVFW